ncbi:MAG: hypothetical protein AAB691_00365 [Patescibacteria group bacterium]
MKRTFKEKCKRFLEKRFPSGFWSYAWFLLRKTAFLAKSEKDVEHEPRGGVLFDRITMIEYVTERDALGKPIEEHPIRRRVGWHRCHCKGMKEQYFAPPHNTS